ncbi:MAG: zinc-binding dehydrogenase [Solirubrobacteraceae bacterium]
MLAAAAPQASARSTTRPGLIPPPSSASSPSRGATGSDISSEHRTPSQPGRLVHCYPSHARSPLPPAGPVRASRRGARAEPLRDEAVVAVTAVSLNRGEVHRLERMEPDTVPGWDLAGTISRPATSGSGPPAGARVVGMKPIGAWAEQVTVPTEYLAELPDGISGEQAATLPVAGLTALRSLELGGFVLGKRVLVTGASGGVGRFAVQLASLGGAHVTASPRRAEGLAELGADEVAPELTGEGETFDVVVDAIGGPVLGAAIQRVAPRGTIVSFAATVPEPVSYPTRELFSRAPGAQVHGLYIFDELRHTRSASAATISPSPRDIGMRGRSPRFPGQPSRAPRRAAVSPTLLPLGWSSRSVFAPACSRTCAPLPARATIREKCPACREIPVRSVSGTGHIVSGALLGDD